MSFRYLTAGESHGKALIGIMEGIPSGLEITTDYIHAQLKRRKLGYGRGARQKIESDAIEILSGVRVGKTLGSPISLLIENQDWQVWKKIMQIQPSDRDGKREVHVPRPGHADLIGSLKYHHSDMRNVLERSSARETAIRVGLGTIARKFLEELGIAIGSRVIRLGGIIDLSPLPCSISKLNARSDESAVRCTESAIEKEMIALVDEAKRQGDTLGGEFEVHVDRVPPGLGSYSQWDRRLDGKIAEVFMSLNAIKGVEIGLGFKGSHLPGSKVHDEIFPGKERGSIRFQTNHAGGLEGGMTTSQPIVIRASMKPLATLMRPLNSVDLRTGFSSKAHIERSDVCAVPAAAVIGESLAALVLTEAILEKFGGDSMSEIQKRVCDWNHESFIEKHRD